MSVTTSLKFHNHLLKQKRIKNPKSFKKLIKDYKDLKTNVKKISKSSNFNYETLKQ